jgi:hypothetical protein
MPSMTTGLVAAEVSASMMSVVASFDPFELVLSLARAPGDFIGNGYGPRLDTSRTRGFPPPVMAE